MSCRKCEECRRLDDLVQTSLAIAADEAREQGLTGYQAFWHRGPRWEEFVNTHRVLRGLDPIDWNDIRNGSSVTTKQSSADDQAWKASRLVTWARSWWRG